NDIYKLQKSFSVNDGYTINLFCQFSRSDLNSKIVKSNYEIGLISLLFFSISFILLFSASIILMLPLRKISESANKISAGSLDERIKNNSNTEFNQIANSINLLAEDLQKANSQIEKLNKELKFQFRDKIGELNYEINQKRQTESLLKQSEEQFRLLFDLAPIGMIISSLHGKILKVNAALHTALGYTETEILEKKIKDLTYFEDQSIDVVIHEKLVGDIQQSAYYEKRMLRKDGQVIYVIVEAVIVKNKAGKPSHFIEQVIDITERKRVEKELIFAKEKAEESDRLKSAFLAQMSHEIRTPLNVILTAMNLIHDDLDDADEDTKMILDSVSSAGKRLQRTIDLILNISAVQSGSYSPESKVFDLDKELMILVEEFKTFENEKDIKISYANKSKYSMIIADYYSVMQIFQNLIGNAIKYTLKGSVNVSLDDFNEEKLQVVVKDTGIGISKEYIANLFAPFSQEDVGYKREFEGNGLGLALVKKYVEINNADILVESQKDRGSTFTVIFNKKSMNSNELRENVSLKSDNIKELA
ncbi:MAG TPA: ATP-binding protein, partial [Ignavibacteriaceae bacterium]